jgi:hypothetical protein
MATDFFKIGKATGQQFVDVSGAVQRGLESGLKPFVEYEKSRKERTEALGRILQKTPNLAELPKIPAQYSSQISKWAVNAKNEYATAARTLVQTSADSPEYQAAIEKINSINNAFINLDNQLKGIREERIEYLDDYQTDSISAGYINGDLEQAYGENGTITEIDTSGNVSLSGADNKSFKWNERQEHFNKSGKVAQQWDGISEAANKIGLEGQEKDLTYFIEKSRLAIGTYDLPLIKSLVFDDLDGIDGRLDQNIEGIDSENEVLNILTSPPDREKIIRLKDILAQKIGRGLFDVYQKGKSQYNKKLQATAGTGKPAKEQEAMERATRAYNLIVQDPVAYAKTKLGKGFKGSQGNSRITLQVDDKDKTYDLTKPVQFQEFMEIVRKNSGLFQTGAEGAELARAMFYNIVIEQSKKISEIQTGREKEQKALAAEAISTAIPGINPINTSDLPILNN